MKCLEAFSKVYLLCRKRQDERLYHNRILQPLLRSRGLCLAKASIAERKKENVMKQAKDNRTKWLHVRLSESEYNAVHSNFNKTTERKISDYTRKILLGKPMVKGLRNMSLQDIVTELFALRKDLNGIANNFNQAVKQLHSHKQTLSVEQWLRSNEQHLTELFISVDNIKKYISKTTEKWLQD